MINGHEQFFLLRVNQPIMLTGGMYVFTNKRIPINRYELFRNHLLNHTCEDMVNIIMEYIDSEFEWYWKDEVCLTIHMMPAPKMIRVFHFALYKNKIVFQGLQRETYPHAWWEHRELMMNFSQACSFYILSEAETRNELLDPVTFDKIFHHLDAMKYKCILPNTMVCIRRKD